MLTKAFDPNEPRDDIGRWTNDGHGPELRGKQTITDLHGNKLAAPRTFYKAANEGDERRIKTGDDNWDSHLFMASNVESASPYGRNITRWDAKPEARILYEGTKEFRTLAKGLKGSLLSWASGVTQRAAGKYDAVWFKRQSDIGTAVLNPNAFVKRGLMPESLSKGDEPGHPFRGNQYTEGQGGGQRTGLKLSQWRLPPEPGTAPIKPGYVRLYHQTSIENLGAIKHNGIRPNQPFEGPRGIYADEKGFYGKPTERATVEFQVPKERWDPPFVLPAYNPSGTVHPDDSKVLPKDIIAVHYPWHEHVRYAERDPRLLQAILAGEHDSLLTDHDYGKVVRYIKHKYGVKKVIEIHGRDARVRVMAALRKAFPGLAWNDSAKEIEIVGKHAGARVAAALLPLLKGEGPGHPFRGNQYTEGASAINAITPQEAAAKPGFAGFLHPDGSIHDIGDYDHAEAADKLRTNLGALMDKGSYAIESHPSFGTLHLRTTNHGALRQAQVDALTTLADSGRYQRVVVHKGGDFPRTLAHDDGRKLSGQDLRHALAYAFHIGKFLKFVLHSDDKLASGGYIGVKKFDPNQPRDDWGRWTTGGAIGHGELGHGYSDKAYIVNGVVHTSNVYDAVRALYENRKVELVQPREVSTLLDKLAPIAKRMIELHEHAPNFNLCNVSVKGTNLFCADTVGIPRIKMPQVKDPTALLAHLQSAGVKIENTTEKASYLRATQSELIGASVSRLAQRVREGTYYLDKHPMVISRDNYLLDGHHRWAAAIGIDALDNKFGDITMRVTRVDLPILDLLEEAQQFSAERQGVHGIKEQRWLHKGEGPGHPFRGNQYTEGQGGGVSDKDAARIAQLWSGGEMDWESLQHAVRAVITGTPRDKYVCYDCPGNDQARYDTAKWMLDKVANAPVINKTLYRGIGVDKDYKVGDRFSESLSSWTGRRELADQFAGNEYGSRLSMPGKHGIVLKLLSTDNAHGLALSPHFDKTRARLAGADEYLTSGEYEVTSVEHQASGPSVVLVKRVGKAQAKGLAKFDPDQPRDYHGRWADSGGLAEDDGKAGAGDSILVFRIGSEKGGLQGRNAGNASSVADYLMSIDDPDRPSNAAGSGDTLSAYKLTLLEEPADYERGVGGRGIGDHVGRHVRTYNDGSVYVAYSLPASGKGYSYERIGSVPISAVRDKLRAMGFDGYGSASDAGQIATTKAIRQAIQDKLRKFDPNQPRDYHGRWTSGGAAEGTLADMPESELRAKVVKIAADDVAKELGFDPSLISINTGDRKFTLNGREYNTAGLAYRDSGKIELFSKHIEQGSTGTITAHEVMHQKFNAFMSDLETERQARDDEIRRLTQEKGSQWVDQNVISPADDTLKEPYASKYPLNAEYSRIRAQPGWDQMYKDDGVTLYSREWWNAWHKGEAMTDQAVHETLAEIAALDYTYKTPSYVYRKPNGFLTSVDGPGHVREPLPRPTILHMADDPEKVDQFGNPRPNDSQRYAVKPLSPQWKALYDLVNKNWDKRHKFGKAFDPNEPRDERGRWTGSASPTAEAHKAWARQFSDYASQNAFGPSTVSTAAVRRHMHTHNEEVKLAAAAVKVAQAKVNETAMAVPYQATPPEHTAALNEAKKHLRAVERAARVAAGLITKYSPDEPRDERGRWTTGGARSRAANSLEQRSPVERLAEAHEWVMQQPHIDQETARSIADKLATEAGFDPKMIRFDDNASLYIEGGKMYQTHGTYDHIFGLITLHLPGITDATHLTGIMTHEIEHAKFVPLSRMYDEQKREHFSGVSADRTPVFNALMPYLGLGDTANKLVAEDGVTHYSQAFWNKALSNPNTPKLRWQATNETLAEIAAIKSGSVPGEQHALTRSIAPVWEEFYKTVDDLYQKYVRKLAKEKDALGHGSNKRGNQHDPEYHRDFHNSLRLIADKHKSYAMGAVNYRELAASHPRELEKYYEEKVLPILRSEGFPDRYKAGWLRAQTRVSDMWRGEPIHPLVASLRPVGSKSKV